MQKMLNDLEVGRRTEECKRAEEFEKRRKDLWDVSSLGGGGGG